MRLFLGLALNKKHAQTGLKAHTNLGLQSGDLNNSQSSLEAFDLFIKDGGGYTSLAVTLSLLLCLCLTFSLAAGVWIQNRSADVQTASDATALAGVNVVASYTTLAQTLDASVLTIGLAGVFTLGAGLVVSAIPGLSSQGVSTISAGLKILSTRQKFASSVSEGLKKLEGTLPLLIVARSAAVLSENNSEVSNYLGCAIPYPSDSKSDFSSFDAALDTKDIEIIAKSLQDTSDEVKRLEDLVDASAYEGWLADCGHEVLGDGSMSLYQRAQTLAGLSSAHNKLYASEDDWNFGAALARARSYYDARLRSEGPLGSSENLRGDSRVRSYFYQYAQAEVNKGKYIEFEDGSVDMYLPKLPYNAPEIRQTPLYTNYLWPCSVKGGSYKIHSVEGCRGAAKSKVFYTTMAAFDGYASKSLCSYCKFSSASMCNVSAASTNIDNGFEFYWRKIYEASLIYSDAANKLAHAKKELKQLSEKSASLFNELLETLTIARPKICPPGAYGCVAAVWRSGELETPHELISLFTTNAHVGPGAAVSAAVLATDNNADANDVLVRLTQTLSSNLNGVDAGILGNVGELWSSILSVYSSAYDGIGSAVDSALSKIEGIPGSSAASWLCTKVSDVVKAAGFEPADLRLRKPVLTNSQNVFNAAGHNNVATARQFVELLGQSKNPKQFAQTVGQDLSNKLEGKTFTVGEIQVPGSEISVPITVDLGELFGAVF